MPNTPGGRTPTIPALASELIHQLDETTPHVWLEPGKPIPEDRELVAKLAIRGLVDSLVWRLARDQDR